MRDGWFLSCCCRSGFGRLIFSLDGCRWLAGFQLACRYSESILWGLPRNSWYQIFHPLLAGSFPRCFWFHCGFSLCCRCFGLVIDSSDSWSFDFQIYHQLFWKSSGLCQGRSISRRISVWPDAWKVLKHVNLILQRIWTGGQRSSRMNCFYLISSGWIWCWPILQRIVLKWCLLQVKLHFHLLLCAKSCSTFLSQLLWDHVWSWRRRSSSWMSATSCSKLNSLVSYLC